MDFEELINTVFSNCVKMQKKAFKRGDVITNYIEKRKQICILISGKADLIRYERSGNKDIIESYSRKDIFGEAMYPVNTNNELFVQATTDCEVMLFAYDDVRTKCKNNCKYHSILVSNLLDMNLNNAIKQNMRIEILSKRTIREKLLSYFSLLSARNFSKNIIIPISLTNLADYLSVDRSAMMREMKSLSNEGFISKSGNRIKLLF